MIDVSEIKYRVIAISHTGKQTNLKEFVKTLSFEDSKNELAQRINLTLRNEKVDGKYLSDRIPVGDMINIYAKVGNVDREVATGFINTVDIKNSNNESEVSYKCFDRLYLLQKSQDNFYIPDGTNTKNALELVLKDQGLKIGKYQGPNISHAKTVFNNKYLSDCIMELLGDSKSKNEKKFVVLLKNDKLQILEKGSNKEIYVFDETNAINTTNTFNIADLVTRVKVYGQENEEGNKAVEGSVEGLVKFGLRQSIYSRGKDESIDDATQKAQGIINEKGKIKNEIRLEAPDIPWLRKGDKIYVNMLNMKGFYYVESVRHDADNYKMSIEIIPAEKKKIKDNKEENKKEYNVGDIVDFKGGTHYVSSYSDAKGYPASAGKAKITIKNGSGKTHPWHLIHTDNSSNVYGWVDDGTFS